MNDPVTWDSCSHTSRRALCESCFKAALQAERERVLADARARWAQRRETLLMASTGPEMDNRIEFANAAIENALKGPGREA